MTKQKNGMELKKGNCGIPDMENQHGKKENLMKKLAWCVQNNTTLSIPTDLNSAKQAVNKDIIENTTLKKKSVFASIASLFSKFMNILLPEHVVNIAQVKLPTIQGVYDLTIDIDGCYYANGLLVSNSDAFRMLALTQSEFRSDQGISDGQYDRMKGLWGWKV